MSNYVNPNSEVYLLNVSISNDYKNQYSFPSLEAQTNFFLNKANGNVKNELTFVKDGEIILEGQLYSFLNSNYMMFKNTGFSNKWFYAFITDMEYVNENATRIFYELDVFQSWYFELNYKTSFIVRQHVTDDTIGANTLDEGLGYGDYIIRNSDYLKQIENWYYVIVATEKMDEDKIYGIYDNIFSRFCLLCLSR